VNTDITISARRAGTADIEVIDDLDVLSETALCACAAGDDQPF
jgi:hypothetical protein